MKNVYWRPQKVSRHMLVAVAIIAVGGLALIEFNSTRGQPLCADMKRTAAQRASLAMQAIKEEQLRRGHQIDSMFDPAQTGLVGLPMTQVTTRPADLVAKQTSINPNFAAALVDMLLEAGVHEGDTVAVGWSGSFPALNISLSAAMEAMKLRPVIVASATSSQYGANDPDFLWIDMERVLHNRGLLPYRCDLVSIGGAADRGMGMSDEAIELIEQAIQRNNLPALRARRRATAIQQRMLAYRRLSAERPIKAYINVGGGVASTGGEEGKTLFRPGLNQRANDEALAVDCVMTRFAKAGTPVVHLIETVQLARQYDFPISPATMPAIGLGKPFVHQSYSRGLAALLLVVIIAALRSFVLTRSSHAVWQGLKRLLSRTKPPRLRLVPESPEPQLMV